MSGVKDTERTPLQETFVEACREDHCQGAGECFQGPSVLWGFCLNEGAEERPQKSLTGKLQEHGETTVRYLRDMLFKTQAP